MAHDSLLNPVDKLLAAADIANRQDPAQIPALLALLRDKEPAVRYWGAVGLIALGAKAEPAGATVAKALADGSPNVRVAAAEVLCNINRHQEALPLLTKALGHPSPFIRLRAINVFGRIGEHARPALRAMRTAGMWVGLRTICRNALRHTDSGSDHFFR